MEGDAQDTTGKTPASAVRKPPGDPLTVSHSVIVEMVRVAALEVPGVLKVSRGGPLARLSGSPVRARMGEGRVSVRVWIMARPGHPLGPLAAQVRQAVGATIVRLLGLELGEVTVVVDGVGGWGS
ncbi:MAG: Asp23/Gls24 family envelope stress response protein [Candidatus Limnocylindrales bacterium]|jgi:uncharacterized alkaline shock family protein YloU